MTDAFQAGRSLEEVNRSVQVTGMRWWRRLFAFVGPAYMVSVGYMDPGNWATDLAGGASFGYSLIWVLLLSNILALILQTLSARLGLVTGRDLAQACRDAYPPPIRWALFALCELAIVACDLAEVLGSAVGLNLLFGLPVLYGVVLTGADVLILLVIQRLGIRKMEGFIVMLVAMIGLCFVIEVFLSSPDWGGAAGGFVPRPLSGGALYIAIGMIGATVMPHNLYLHSALVQSRAVERNRPAVAQACKYNLIDSAIALNGAFFVNAAILVVSAAVFWRNGQAVTELQDAHKLLGKLLGSDIAPIAFAIGLICAGQSSTLTGTLAGQITMEGFLNFRMRAWLRRVLTRALAIGPAVAVILAAGSGRDQDSAVYRLLILSQVVLSLQLSFAVVPLVKFTGSKLKIGPFASRLPVKVLAWIGAIIIAALNATLVYQQVGDWMAAAGPHGWLVGAAVIPVAAALGALLLWMVFKPEPAVRAARIASAEQVATAAGQMQKRFRRIGVALEAKDTDAAMLAEAVAFARVHSAEIILMHVVEGVGGQWYGPQTGDLESRGDEQYVTALADRLRKETEGQGIPEVRAVLGYGQVARQLARLARSEQLDLMVLGGHGHKGLSDMLHGTTINAVRHDLHVPILAVRE